MPVPRLSLRDAPAAAAGLPTRADVALFAGLVARGANALSDELHAALEAAGWAGAGPYARPPQQVDALLDVPVAVESWNAFEALYAWNARPADADAVDGATVPCALGIAVKSFFEEGGAKAWIVRTGDPLPLLTSQTPAETGAARKRLLSLDAPQPADKGARVPLVPGWKTAAGPGDAREPATWHGYEHVFGLDDVAFLLLPDLPELLALPAAPAAPLPGPPPVPEQWKTCAPVLPGVLPDARPTPPPIQAPRLDRAGFGDWSALVAFVLERLNASGTLAHRRDVMLLASLPLPSMQPGAVPARSQAWPLALLSEPGIGVAGQALLDCIPGARVQFVYPWLQTQASLGLPEGLQAPEGVFAGVLARSALAMGTFRVAAGQSCFSVRRLAPVLGTADIERGLPGAAASWLGERLSLLGERAGRFVLLSDATFAANPGWRAGGTSRLMGVIIRAARWLGAQRLFDASGPALWASVRRDFEALLEALRSAGALDGASPADAYQVRCDASTMSQEDIDAGRLIVSIAVNPAQPVGWITVTLAVGGLADSVREAA
ncbi:hypothetical protein [Paraburkholderia atlantica]|uniref:hypothetical protein n=1 Tax=Paraburkholderia atlantica TaxID=2654982 RepID=UPI003D1A0DED